MVNFLCCRNTFAMFDWLEISENKFIRPTRNRVGDNNHRGAWKGYFDSYSAGRWFESNFLYCRGIAQWPEQHVPFRHFSSMILHN